MSFSQGFNSGVNLGNLLLRKRQHVAQMRILGRNPDGSFIPGSVEETTYKHKSAIQDKLGWEQNAKQTKEERNASEINIAQRTGEAEEAEEKVQTKLKEIDNNRKTAGEAILEWLETNDFSALRNFTKLESSTAFLKKMGITSVRKLNMNDDKALLNSIPSDVQEKNKDVIERSYFVANRGSEEVVLSINDLIAYMGIPFTDNKRKRIGELTAIPMPTKETETKSSNVQEQVITDPKGAPISSKTKAPLESVSKTKAPLESVPDEQLTEFATKLVAKSKTPQGGKDVLNWIAKEGLSKADADKRPYTKEWLRKNLNIEGKTDAEVTKKLRQYLDTGEKPVTNEATTSSESIESTTFDEDTTKNMQALGITEQDYQKLIDMSPEERTQELDKIMSLKVADIIEKNKYEDPAGAQEGLTQLADFVAATKGIDNSAKKAASTSFNLSKESNEQQALRIEQDTFNKAASILGKNRQGRTGQGTIADIQQLVKENPKAAQKIAGSAKISIFNQITKSGLSPEDKKSLKSVLNDSDMVNELSQVKESDLSDGRVPQRFLNLFIDKILIPWFGYGSDNVQAQRLIAHANGLFKLFFLSGKQTNSEERKQIKAVFANFNQTAAQFRTSLLMQISQMENNITTMSTGKTALSSALFFGTTNISIEKLREAVQTMDSEDKGIFTAEQIKESNLVVSKAEAEAKNKKSTGFTGSTGSLDAI